ncbi:hypothetical protein PINS_up014260 [Pythium insidiosum]|nr:hypothetical protein PINS_up014260 [Pythium insidiosum]
MAFLTRADDPQPTPSPSGSRRPSLRRRLGLTRSKPQQSCDDDAVDRPIPLLSAPVSPACSAPSFHAATTTPQNKRATDSLTDSEGPEVTPARTSSPSSSSSSSVCTTGRKRRASSVDSTGSDQTSISLSRKGVSYGADGSIVCCRFCDILRTGDAEFLYEDTDIAVFRPLYPVADSHVLVVPRCHIRNIKMLTEDHVALLQRMRTIAERVLTRTFEAASSSSCTFAFHSPPFNSIDHVHMHAFRKNERSFGCIGSIKYRTATWWCRSFDEVVARLARAARGEHEHAGPRRLIHSEPPPATTCVTSR